MEENRTQVNEENKIQLSLFSVFKYLVFFALFYLLCGAHIEGVYAFGFGMLFALVWCNQKIYILAPMYVLANFLVFGTLDSVIIAGATALVFCLAYLAHYKFKKALSPVLIVLYAIISQSVYLWYNFGAPEDVFLCVITVVIGVLFLTGYLHIMQSIILRGLKRKFTVDEAVAGGITLLAIGLGLACVPEAGLYIVKFAAAFIVLMCCFVYSGAGAILTGVILGFGASLGTMDPSFIGVFALYGVAAGAFRGKNRAFAAIALLLIDVFLGLFLNAPLPFDYYSVAAVLFGALLFTVLPSAAISRLAGALVSAQEETGMRSIVNRSREALCKRLLEISEVFLEMQHTYRNLVKGTLPIEEAGDYLAGEVMQKMCDGCPERNKCLKLNSNQTQKVLSDLIGVAFSKGRVTIIDVPQYLTSRCNKVNVVLSSINAIVTEYRQYVNMVNNVDTSRVLIGEHLYGVSKIMANLAGEIKRNITYDVTKENQIIEDLLYEQITCAEAVVYEQNFEVCSVTLVVKNKDVHNPAICKVVSRSVGSNMQIVSINISERATFSIVNLRTAPKYDMVFGSSGAKKAGSSVSGDTHSILRIGDDKYLMALCDGMGSGEKAEKTSALAISLIENFYKAGFDSGLILSSVNKLLSMGGEENFSAIDVSVVDLRTGICDLIKVGSPACFIKHSESVEVVESGALPLGILEDITPCVNTKPLNEIDIIVLVTDGVAESFDSVQELCDFINNLRTINPQTIADCVLDEALKLNKNAPKDDLTVLAGRIFPK